MYHLLKQANAFKCLPFWGITCHRHLNVTKRQTQRERLTTKKKKETDDRKVIHVSVCLGRGQKKLLNLDFQELSISRIGLEMSYFDKTAVTSFAS